jgi:uncharacterized protein YgiM (DUF1202 family)
MPVFCKYCGTKVEQTQRLCIGCGKEANPSAQMNTPIVNQAEALPSVLIKSRETVPKETIDSYPVKFRSKGMSRQWIILLISFLFVLGAGLSWLLFFSKEKKKYPVLFVMAENLNLRSSQFDRSEANVIDQAPYGSEISIIKEEGEWARVKYNNQDGYMSRKYLVTARDFFEADAIVSSFKGDTLKISETRFKKSLVRYFRSNNMRGMLTLDIEQKYFKDDAEYKNRSLWRIESAGYNSQTVLKGHFSGYKKNGLALIIKNEQDYGKRKLLIFIYNDDENEVVSTVFDEPSITNIWLVEKGSFEYTGRYGSSEKPDADVIGASIPGEDGMGFTFFIFRNGRFEKDFKSYNEEVIGD